MVVKSEAEIVCAPMDGNSVTVTFHKNIGDFVEADEVVADIESDKATIEVSSPVWGSIDKIFVET